jgi:hypothetical protein
MAAYREYEREKKKYRAKLKTAVSHENSPPQQANFTAQMIGKAMKKVIPHLPSCPQKKKILVKLAEDAGIRLTKTKNCMYNRVTNEMRIMN